MLHRGPGCNQLLPQQIFHHQYYARHTLFHNAHFSIPRDQGLFLLVLSLFCLWLRVADSGLWITVNFQVLDLSIFYRFRQTFTISSRLLIFPFLPFNFHFLIRFLMDICSTFRWLVTCGVFLIRLGRASTFCPFRSARYLCRSQYLQNKGISLYRVSHRGRFNVRPRTNGRRFSLLYDNVLHFVRSRSYIVRHTSTRGNWQDGLCGIRLRMFLWLNNKCRVLRNVMRQLRVQICLVFRIAKRRARFFTNFCNKTTRSSFLSFLVLRYTCNGNGNNVYLSQANQTSDRCRVVLNRTFRRFRLILTPKGSQLSNSTRRGCISILFYLQNVPFSSISSGFFF